MTWMNMEQKEQLKEILPCYMLVVQLFKERLGAFKVKKRTPKEQEELIGEDVIEMKKRVKAQRALQLNQEEVNSEDGASEKSSEEEIVEENSKEDIQDNMADNANNQRRTLADYTNPTTASCGSSIVWHTVDANNFELKPALV
ncbi:hypothetical protein PIB30_085790 [Stylosanthes scabra]|uniref:Uncharacterized protein n=1 Tax=Stylosanthes scabra TaxID=79078 RepID=A0ABU6YR71_9FABA|nr:hypothetical protein [Stylosanthes scabra]